MFRVSTLTYHIPYLYLHVYLVSVTVREKFRKSGGKVWALTCPQWAVASLLGQNIRFLIGIFILQKTRQRFWLSSAIAGQPDVAAAFGLRV